MVQHSAIDHTGLTGAGGSVATDAIWDAKGDLAGGTGANTAAKLTVGTNTHVLIADSAQSTGLKWGQPAGTLLGYKVDTTGDNTTTSATMADVDATNSAVTFTAPASTNVLVRLTARVTADSSGGNNVGAYTSWGLRESSTDIAGAAGTSIVARCSLNSGVTVIYQAASIVFVLTGISAGSHTYKWSHATSAGTSQIGATANSPAVMEVWALP